MKTKLNGKQKCEMLRNIRKEIAARNNIEYLTADCTYKGDCIGTCPKCDAEVRYLEYELNRKIHEGEQVTLSGINNNLAELIDQVEKAVKDSHENNEIKKDYLLEGEIRPQKEEVSLEGFDDYDSPDMGMEVADVASIDELDLSVRAYNRLKRCGINTLYELCDMSEKDLLSKPMVDTHIITEIKGKLEERGLSLSK